MKIRDMMANTPLLTAAVACGMFLLMGCNNRNEVRSLQAVQPLEAKAMQQNFRGLLPCADCEGIDTALFLEKDGSWVMNQRYQGAPQPTQFASWGKWARTADKLVLTDTNGEKYYFRVKGENLEMLDRDGNPIESPLNYTLTPSRAALPVTPMTMKGLYFYKADAAVFTDCATGKRFPVMNNAQLERGFAAAQQGETKPVLLHVEGHFILQANPDSGAMQKTLVADNPGAFKPGADCDD